MRRAAILTVSDRSYLALRADASGPRIAERLRALSFQVAHQEIVPDDRARIASVLRAWCDERLELVLTTGGTGLAPRDRTPEATIDVAHRNIPGIPEWIRTACSARHPFAALSRGVAVVRDSTLIVNLPGSPTGADEYLDLLERILEHALRQIAQRPDFGPSLPHFDRSGEEEGGSRSR